MTPFETYELWVQVPTVILLLATVFVYFRQLRAMQKQLDIMNEQFIATTTEMGWRLRPWIGLYSIKLLGANFKEDFTGNILHIVLRNIGPLPAKEARLSLVMRPEDGGHWEIVYKEQESKVLLAGEPGNYRVDLKELNGFEEFTDWRCQCRNVVLHGNMTYSLGQSQFYSNFRCTFYFDGSGDASGRRYRWRNVEVV